MATAVSGTLGPQKGRITERVKGDRGSCARKHQPVDHRVLSSRLAAYFPDIISLRRVFFAQTSKSICLTYTGSLFAGDTGAP